MRFTELVTTRNEHLNRHRFNDIGIGVWRHSAYQMSLQNERNENRRRHTYVINTIVFLNSAIIKSPSNDKRALSSLNIQNARARVFMKENYCLFTCCKNSLSGNTDSSQMVSSYDSLADDNSRRA